jgi:pyrimidine-nucleoside phosphorylase/thymidine phosphorylase
MKLRALDVIAEKRSGGEHHRDTLERFIAGYLAGDIPDYQVAAWLMAVVWRGMTPSETAHLTEVMAASGEQLDLSAFPYAIDKHSTGGVGDKTTLVVAPLAAALGAQVAKMSGRGLGHTGGTIDKLEAIPGFRAELSSQAFMEQVARIGVAITGQTGQLAPADGALYALRDATGTVASLPLIASSIMSKKLAGGAKSIVLDVKVGSGAFMKTAAEARALAEAMVAIGTHAGRKVRALLTEMAQPLGNAVGHTLEVQEALATLRGGGPADLRELAVALCFAVLQPLGLVQTPAEVAAALDDGRAATCFEAWVSAQGGEVARLDTLEVAPDQELVRATDSGVLGKIDAEKIGLAVVALGGGRKAKGDRIDLSVGASLHAKVGQELRAGEPILTLHHRAGRGVEEARALLADALAMSTVDSRGTARGLILGTVLP